LLGIVVQLLISWALLRFIEKKNLSVLGIAPTLSRLKDAGFGLLLPVIYFSLLFIAMAYLVKNPYKINGAYNIGAFLDTLIYLLKSIFFEGLIFTGAILYILIQRIGPMKATLISGIAFGIYHWFSWNVFGQPIQMLQVFLTTGVAGYLWALAFYKTKSIYLPFALHLGVDLVFALFSKYRTLTPQLLVPRFERDPARPDAFISWTLTILYFAGLPLITYFYFRMIRVTSAQEGLTKADTLFPKDQNSTTKSTTDA
jgi:uncharacterized protein